MTVFTTARSASFTPLVSGGQAGNHQPYHIRDEEAGSSTSSGRHGRRDRLRLRPSHYRPYTQGPHLLSAPLTLGF